MKDIIVKISVIAFMMAALPHYKFIDSSKLRWEGQFPVVTLLISESSFSGMTNNQIAESVGKAALLWAQSGA